MKKIIVYSFFVLLTSFGSKSFAMINVVDPDSTIQTDSFVFVECTMQDSIIDYADNFLGVRYRYGGKSKKGFDCTGFVQTVYERFGYSTPRSSSAIKTVGKEVERDSAEVGDLIYFKGRNSRSKRPGHVGIITEIKEGVIYFIHASVNYGISYSSTNSRYYKRRYLGIRRVIDE